MSFRPFAGASRLRAVREQASCLPFFHSLTRQGCKAVALRSLHLRLRGPTLTSSSARRPLRFPLVATLVPDKPKPNREGHAARFLCRSSKNYPCKGLRTPMRRPRRRKHDESARQDTRAGQPSNSTVSCRLEDVESDERHGKGRRMD